MISKNVLREEDLTTILGKGLRRKDKNQELLQKLWRGNQAWFDHFIQALQSHGYSTLANQILETHVDPYDELEEDLSDDDDGNKNIPQYNRELNTRYIKDWLDEDKRFIPTTASSNVEDMVKKRNCVLVVGGSGDGKSSLIRHIAVRLWREEDYDIVPIVMVPLIISQFYNADRKQVFVVDDFCGRDRIYETSLDLWVLPHYTNRFADIIESVTRLDQKDVPKKSIKILIACNSNVYNEPLFNSLDFYKQYSVILSNWPISDNERQHIRKNQLLPDHMEGSVKDLQLKGFSFPLLCKLSHGKLSDQIRAFFENPFECIKQDIKNIKEQQDVQFYVICLLALFDNSFNVDWLLTKHLTEMEKNSIDDISSHFNINLEDELHKELIKGSLDILEKTYLFKSDRTYRIVDDKIYDIAATICGEFLFRHFVNYASSKFLAERYKLETIQSESDEMKMFICIKRGKENFYFDRLIRDLENGDTYSFLHNKQLQHSIYREKFMKHCRKESTRIRTILVKLKDKENNNSSQKDKSVSPIEFKDLEDNSCYTYLKLNPTIEIARIGIPLIESVIEGYEEIVNFLIEMGSDVNVIHTFGRSALYISAVLGYKDILQLLITKKANISLCDHKGRSALYIACKMGHDEIVDKLLGTIQCEVEQCDDTQSTPLHAASLMGHDHVVKILLRKKHKIDPLDNQDRTPLFLASECGHTEVVSTLIHAGSNLSAKNKHELTPLFAACNNNKKAVADLLLKRGASISEVDRNGRSPLLIASNNGSDEVVKLLLDERIKADIGKCDNQGCSALYLACDGGHETTVNLLLENGISVNKCNANGMSPLHVACVKGIVNMVNTLLSHNASVEAVDHDRQTALHLNCDKGNIHTLKLLLEHKNIINSNDKHGDSPLHVACKRGSKKIVELIMESGADIDHCNSKEKQPLHIACCEGHYEIVNVLLKRHAEINRKDIDGATPLFLACKMGHIQITRLLIERKADVRICDHQKWSPLHVACNCNHYDIVQALLDKAPDIISEKDNQGKTALDFALKISDSSKIVELLKEKTLLNKLDNN
ncbi:Hypothetical predicted protein [Mytilus galloprovincialis]|uniref:CARD domain-containing protein n=1 Tax=Mytilus galloprovincialis TaxID=29158 RepID=A0A8B6FJL2_MYTGA|nr:Hypothetical predicted protein [Mytilus galloprovincialis]